MTGVLPIALNRACRLSDYFMKKNKSYVGVMHIHSDVELNKLKQEIKKFTGKIIQLPPVKSRVKREEREREVYSFKILEQEGKDVLFEAEVEAGTYVRKLVSDLGLKIGGAHMTELRRIKAGIFSENDNFVNLYDFEKAVNEFEKGNEEKLREILIPGEIISTILPIVQANKKYVEKLLKGSPVFENYVKGKLDKIKEGDKFCIFSGSRFIEVARKVQEGKIIARPEFVLS